MVDVAEVSNKTIWKWDLLIAKTQVLFMPKEATILSVQVQRDRPVLWALIDKRQPIRDRVIITYFTDDEMPENPGKYIGSYQNKLETLVFHVFEQEVVG